LATKIGVSVNDETEKLLARIRDAALAVDMPRMAWVLKHASAKRLLKAHPPKALMKMLGYKSLDSMLKREPIHELFAGLLLVESASWYEKFLSNYHTLLPMDFEKRAIEVCVLDKAKWQHAAKSFAQKQHHNIMHLRDIGTVVILPLPFAARPGLVITLLPMVLHHINEIRLYSAYYKLHQMQLGFGERIALSLLRDEGAELTVAGQKVHWRVAQRHFSRAKRHAEVLEPHVEAEDLAWRRAEEVLFRLEPALHFWHETDFVAESVGKKPISFNLLDAALNFLNDLPYEDRVFNHFRESLWNELFVRYISEPALEAQVLRQLDYESAEPEAAVGMGV
jgi:hypothetical protein